jgi:hypothetical protein
MIYDVDILVPLQGEAIVKMRYREGNRIWLRDAVETRRPAWHPEDKSWRIPRAAVQRVFDQATVEGLSAKLTRQFRPTAEKCTAPCQTASVETVSTCTCICGGKGHGQASGGWKAVGRELLVRSSGGVIEQTIINNISP